METKMKLLKLVREWRDEKKITKEEYVRVQRIVSPRSTRKGKTYNEIYGTKRSRAERHKLRFARSNRALLERSRTLAILRALHKKSRYIRNLQEEAGGSNSTIISRVDALEETGFVVTDYEKAYPHRRMIKLTQKGQNFTRGYVGVEQGIGNNV